MFQLNLPAFEIKLKGTPQRPLVLDPLRRKYVKLTPEEWVRQHFVNYLVNHKGYPASLLANEVSLQLGGKQLRADGVLYDSQLRPRMLMEYKAPTVALSQEVVNQAAAYNLLLHVDYLIISNGLDHYCFRMDYTQQRFLPMDHIPSFEEL